MRTVFYFIFIFFSTILFGQSAETIEIGTFNIRFFPCNQDGELMKKYDINMKYPPTGSATDTTALFRLIAETGVEVLGVQELVDPELFGDMAKRHLGDQFEFVYAPTNAWQKVGILFNSDKVKLQGSAQIYPEIALGKIDRHRPALRAYFKTIPDGFDFHVIVVHLKASPRGLPEREKQWSQLRKIMRELPQDTDKDSDIILLGDFNNVSKQRYNEFLPIIYEQGFYWPVAETDTLTTNYWQPNYKTRRIQSSTIDQIFISNDAKIEYIEGSIRSAGMCADGTQEYTEVFPKYFETISDHCPVISSFSAFPDND